MTRTEIINQAIKLLEDYIDQDVTVAKWLLLTNTISELETISGFERLCKHCEQMVAFSCPCCGAIDE